MEAVLEGCRSLELVQLLQRNRILRFTLEAYLGFLHFIPYFLTLSRHERSRSVLVPCNVARFSRGVPSLHLPLSRYVQSAPHSQAPLFTGISKRQV
jgi:hypothetical protein